MGQGFKLSDLVLQHARFVGLTTQLLCHYFMISGVQEPALGWGNGGSRTNMSCSEITGSRVLSPVLPATRSLSLLSGILGFLAWMPLVHAWAWATLSLFIRLVFGMPGLALARALIRHVTASTQSAMRRRPACVPLLPSQVPGALAILRFP